jgi:NADH-ubiquinone oxidoreductase chain 2
LAQFRLKRLLAFSTISHVGFLLLALSVNSENSISSFLFYLTQYSITNLNAFFIILAFGYVMHKGKDVTFISQLKGEFRSNPILGLSLAVCLFSIAGIPPLLGFFAKYMVLSSAIESKYYFIALVGILVSVVSAAYYLRIIRVVFIETVDNPLLFFPENAVQKEQVLEVSSTHSYIIAVLTLLVTFFILSPSLFLNSSNLLALSLFTA